jgi:anti-sigma factor RsiW
VSQLQQSQYGGPHISRLLPAYVNGRLDAGSIERVRAHLAFCQVCQADLAAWQAIRQAAWGAEAELPLPPANLISRVLDRLDTLEIKQAHFRGPRLT